MLLSKCQVIFSMMSDNQIKVTYIYSNHYDNCDLGNVFKLLHRWWIVWCKPFIPSRHIHSIIKHLVYYTTLGIVKINIFEHFKKYLNSTNIFLKTDNNFTQ